MEFPSDAIKSINTLISEAIKIVSEANAEIKNTLIMMLTSAKILNKLSILSEEEVDEIKKFILDFGDETGNSDEKIS